MSRPRPLGEDTWLLDTELAGQTDMVGVFAQRLPNGRWLLIEAGSGATTDAVRAALRELGAGEGDLAAIVVTHVHLDHAAGAGTLSAAYDAPVYVHPAGARHLADPTRLWNSAARIYGDQMDRLWGPMEPVAEGRLRTLDDGATLEIGGARYGVLHTPGHAKHHLTLIDPHGGAFVGDAAGILLPGVPEIRPALPPPDVDLEAAEASCERIAAARPSRLLLTHFGVVRDVAGHLAEVVRRNRAWAEEVRRGMAAHEDEEALIRRMRTLEEAELDAAGVRDPDARARYRASSDARMTVMGLTRYWNRREAA
ncbi:MAG: MBL fold metallo-hydrolase [Deinococcus-Thermus bacterium]|jgi:glyoxylase-like metal-dependent hydrolase (beta-lactamase superfamily II)|nr:MBL fold metallo-hydrolase [Deinococcota bacterium]